MARNNLYDAYTAAKIQGASDYEIAENLGFFKVDQDGDVDYDDDGNPKIDVKALLREINRRDEFDQMDRVKEDLIEALEDGLLLDVGVGSERLFGITKKSFNTIINDLTTAPGTEYRKVTIFMPMGEGLNTKISVPVMYKGDYDINYIWHHRSTITTCVPFAKMFKGKHKSIQTVMFREAQYRRRRSFLHIVHNLASLNFTDEEIAAILMISKPGVESLKREWLLLTS